MAKTFLYVLATIGALSLIVLMGIIILSIALFNNINDGFLKDVFDGKEGLAERALIIGGLDEKQNFTILHSHPPYERNNDDSGNDLRDYLCIQLEKFEPKKDQIWSSTPEQDALFVDAKQSAVKKEYLEECFGKNISLNDASLQSTIYSINLTGQRKITEATVLFYQASTKRLMYTSFYAYQEE